MRCDLLFSNIDAIQPMNRVVCDSLNVRDIIRWYNAYHAGDTYYVTINGVLVDVDDNGEFTRDIPS